VTVERIAKGSALLRLALGLGQMGGATISLLLLLHYGLTKAALIAVVCTCTLTTASVLLFGKASRIGESSGGKERG
jgi:hypothetical protein